MKRGLTLVELVVVMAMLMALAAALAVSTASAFRRTKIAAAQKEIEGLTAAIGAAGSRAVTCEKVVASRQSLGFILGEGTAGGQLHPVLYAAKLDGQGRMLDPWGNPYRVTIRRVSGREASGTAAYAGVVQVPNAYCGASAGGGQ